MCVFGSSVRLVCATVCLRESVFDGSGSSASAANKREFHFSVRLSVNVGDGDAGEDGCASDALHSGAASDEFCGFRHQERLATKANLVNVGKSVIARFSDFLAEGCIVRAYLVYSACGAQSTGVRFLTIGMRKRHSFS